MARKPQGRWSWIQEAQFIEGCDPKRPPEQFDRNPACFARYVEMQVGFAREDGFADLADRMLACVGVKKWVVRFVRTAPWEIHYPVLGRNEVWGGIYAASADAAWNQFLTHFPEHERDWFRRLGVEEQAQ